MLALSYKQITMETDAKPAPVAFATPDRESNNNTDAPKKSEKKAPPSSETSEANTVTPLDPESDKQVRFDEEQDSSKRGLVSRRGGRLGSPASAPRATTTTPKEGGPVLEFKTFRSPQRKCVENDTIPSLCSTNSGSLDRKLQKEKMGVNTATKASVGEKADSRRPSSISCDPSLSATTSPLASQDVDASPSGQARMTAAAATAASTPTKPLAAAAADEAGARNVTFSPPTPHSKVHAEMVSNVFIAADRVFLSFELHLTSSFLINH